MGATVNVVIDVGKLLDKVLRVEDQLYPLLKIQLKAGSDPYTPYKDGALMGSADVSSKTNDPYLTYDIIYARYQYFTAPHKSPDVHPLATTHWVETYLAAGGREDLQRVVDNFMGTGR